MLECLNKMNKKKSIIKLFKKWIIIYSIGISLGVIIINMFNSYYHLTKRRKQIHTEYITQQKSILKVEVNRAVDLINYERDQINKRKNQKKSA